MNKTAMVVGATGSIGSRNKRKNAKNSFSPSN